MSNSDKLVEKEYKTCDLYFAAYLQAAGCEMRRTSKDGSRLFFVFIDNGNVDLLKIDYFGRKGKVVALDYADRIQSLKALVHS